MKMLFKLWSNGKMKTFDTKDESVAFAKEKGFEDYVLLRIVASEEQAVPEDLVFDIQLESETNQWWTKAHLYRHEKGSWSWTYDLCTGSEQYGKVNDVLKDFVSNELVAVEEEEEEYENIRYSIYDVYTPEELGISMTWGVSSY